MEPGERLGPYEIVSLLGAGGMGEVWLAQDLRLERRVALKVLPQELTRDVDRVSRFQQEARAASGLSHPNVCTIHALDETPDGQHYIAMELVGGETLRARLRTSPLSIREALDIANQIGAALVAAHSVGIVHRDVKPENVMVRPDGLVKVLDFGLAKLLQPGASVAEADTTRTAVRTDAGRVVGTVAYMSPEQARGQDVDARTDVWALGCVLYEMVAGRSPFSAKSGSDVLVAILDRDPSPLARFEPDAPHELQRIVCKALKKDRAERYQSVKELQLDLQTLREELGRGFPGGQSTGSDRASRSMVHEWITAVGRRKGAAGAIAGLLLVLVILVLWYGLRPDGNKPASEPTLTRATANPSTAPISAALISPDGRYVAFADPNGLQVRVLDTGDTQRLANTKGMNLYGWSNDSTKVYASVCDDVTCAGWVVALVGESRYRTASTWPVGDIVIPLPDGSGALRLVAPRQVRLEKPDGTLVRVLSERAVTLAFPTTRDHALLVDNDSVVIQRVDLQSATRTDIWRAPEDSLVWDLAELIDGRIITSIQGPRGAALYELRTDRAGRVIGEARRVTAWLQHETLGWLSASSDGRRVTFLRSRSQGDIYVGAMDGQFRPVGSPNRLTLDERDDVPTTWTPNSKAVIFSSNRNGDTDIFRQDVDADTAQPMVVEAGDQWWPKVSDTRWLLYLVAGGGTQRLMRMPLDGGARELVADMPHQNFVHCPPRGRCIVLEVKPEGMIAFALDSRPGRGVELLKLPSGINAAALLPDGERLAFVVPSDVGERNRIRVMALSGRIEQDVVVKGASNLVSLDVLSNGLGFLSVNRGARQRQLLYVGMDGSSAVLWNPVDVVPLFAIPSPDGKQFAACVTVPSGDVWMMTDF